MEQRPECGHRAARSRVPAYPKIRDGDGRRLPDTRSTMKTDGSGVTMF